MTADPVARAAAAQRRAADPAEWVWVAANAGSGKTRVLTERVARLLLAGARPERILCLTYTKAAAAEMADRLANLLGRWALLDDATLAGELATLTGEAPPPDLAPARRLFAAALETPGGLRIETIHAFCEAALRRFPVEAGVSPAFAVLDDAGRDKLATLVRDGLAEAAARGEDDAFDRVGAWLVEESLDALLDDILANRALFDGPLDEAGVAALFGLAAGALDEDDAGDLAAFGTLCEGDDRSLCEAACEAMAAGKATDVRFAEALRAAIAAADPVEADALIRACFLTQKGEPKSFSKIPTKDLHEAEPRYREAFQRLCEKLHALCERGRARAAARRARDLGRFGRAALAAYAAEKRRRGLLDFDDLVLAAGRMLDEAEGGPAAAWARYKLDRGFDHVLLDEAQDTAPAQWRVLRALVAPLLDAPEPFRSLFVVGDEKQSIYSFQGAEPRYFAEQRDEVAARRAAAGARLLEADLDTSFRSGGAILELVDRVFAPAPEGLTAAAAPPAHRPARPLQASRVDLWPLVEPLEAPEEPPWWVPIDVQPPEAPKPRLARALAVEIARMIREERLPGGGRPVRPGDVLVLVRKRDALAAALVRELKRLGVAVAGADRVRLTEELAVRDLLALARFALTPDDDLTLAALLKSPLCGLSEDDLFALAHGRESRLWPALRASGRHREAFGLLDRARASADFLRPYEFLDRVLTVERGRERLLARLGAEAEDAIDELLAQALAYETEGGAPTLEGFLARLERSEVVIKREMEKAGEGEGAVRVMTVHGAKGLEAPVVILPDTLAGRGRVSPILPAERGGRRLPLWRVPQAEQPAAMREAAAASEEREVHESRRLLYVALTRARSWLIVCGAGKPPKERETWRALVADAFAGLDPARRPAPEGIDGEVLRLETGVEPEAEAPVAAARPDARALPDWTRRRPGAPPEPPRRAAATALAEGASEGGGAPDAAPGAPRDAETARRRGVALHALFETLPGLPAAEREPRGRAILRALLPDAPAPERDAALSEALRCLALPDAAGLFGPGSLAEAPISLDFRGVRVSGRIDRLLVRPDRVLAVDFKSDARPPAPGREPEAYRGQLALYRLALTRLYPGRRVDLAILWTAAPRLDLLDPRALEAALAALPPLDPLPAAT